METNYQCKHCSTTHVGTFCTNCGQKKIEDRWTIKKLFSSATTAIFNVEKGYFYTIKNMITRPGGVVKDYLNGDTVKYTNPFRFALVGIAIAMFISLSLGIWELQMDMITDTFDEMGMYQSEEHKKEARGAMKHIVRFINFLPFVMVPFIALGTKIFLRKQDFNYTEHFIMNSFLLGISMIYGIAVTLITYFVPSMISSIMLFSFLISAFIFSQMFKELFGKSYFKGFLYGLGAYFLGVVIFQVFCGLVGLTIGLTMRFLS